MEYNSLQPALGVTCMYASIVSCKFWTIYSPCSNSLAKTVWKEKKRNSWRFWGLCRPQSPFVDVFNHDLPQKQIKNQNNTFHQSIYIVVEDNVTKFHFLDISWFEHEESVLVCRSHTGVNHVLQPHGINDYKDVFITLSRNKIIKVLHRSRGGWSVPDQRLCCFTQSGSSGRVLMNTSISLALRSLFIIQKTNLNNGDVSGWTSAWRRIPILMTMYVGFFTHWFTDFRSGPYITINLSNSMCTTRCVGLMCCWEWSPWYSVHPGSNSLWSFFRSLPHPLPAHGDIWRCSTLLHGAGPGAVPPDRRHLHMEAHLPNIQR